MRKSLAIRIVLLFVGLQASILSLSAPYTSAQKDSLWSVWNNTQISDSLRFEALMNIGNKIYRDQEAKLDSAAYYCRLGIEFAGKKASSQLLASAFNSLGTIFYHGNQLDSATHYYQLSIDLFDSIGVYGSAAGVLKNLGNIYGLKGDFAKTLSCFKRSLVLLEKDDNISVRAYTLHGIGLVYSELGYYDQSLEYYFKALALYEKVDDPKNQSTLLLDIARALQNVQRYEESQQYFQKTISYAKEYDDCLMHQLALCHLSELQLDLNEMEAATVSLDEMSRIECSQFPTLLKYFLHWGYARVAQTKGQQNEALQQAQKAYTFADELDDFRYKASALSIIYLIYERRGEFEKAHNAFKEYKILSDSITSAKNKEAVLQFRFKLDYQTKYLADSLNFENKQKLTRVQHEAELQREEMLKYLILALLILMSIIVILLIQRYRAKKRLLAATTQKLDYSVKDLEKVAEITRTKKEAEQGLVNRLQGFEETLTQTEDRKRLRKMLHDHGWSEIEWNEENDFLEHIASGSTEFERRLLEKHPQLTKMEVEFCTYLKANYSTKKISQLRNVSIDAVQKAKQRLRQKLGLEKGADLYQLMQEI